MRSRICCRLAAVLAIAPSQNAFAADAGDPTPMPPITITATRTPVGVDESLAAVTVIERADIERLQAGSVPELLRTVPGLTVSSSGGLGKATSVFMRGTNSDHVLVLVDGVRVGSATLGTAAFQDLPVDQIERIEVVRGPRSALYGSEAIGGVIQIFTRRGGGPTRAHLSAGAGSHDTSRVAGGVSGSSGRAWYSVSASHLDSQGINACDGLPFPPGGGCGAIEPDDDAYRNTGGSARAGVRLGSDSEVEVTYLRARARNEFDGSAFAGNHGNVLQEVLGTRLAVQATDIWKLTLTAGRSRDESDASFNGTFLSRFDTERRSAGVQNDLALAPGHLLTLGADYLDDLIESTTAYAESSRHVTGAYAQYQGRLGGHDLLLGARRDDNEQFGAHSTGNIGWGHDVGPVRLTASYGTAFKAPTFNQLYFPFFFGNPDLDPERSRSVEFGVAGDSAGVRWAVNAYETRIRDLIGFDFNVIPNSLNVDRARIRGVELVTSTRVAGFELSGNLSALDPENRSEGADRGNLLPRRSQLQARLDLDRTLGRLRLGGSVYGEGRRYDDLANTRRLGAYGLLDLRAAWALTREITLEGKIANLLDKDYQTARLFNQEGRTFWVAMRYTPGSP